MSFWAKANVIRIPNGKGRNKGHPEQQLVQSLDQVDVFSHFHHQKHTHLTRRTNQGGAKCDDEAKLIF